MHQTQAAELADQIVMALITHQPELFRKQSLIEPTDGEAMGKIVSELRKSLIAELAPQPHRLD